jgi:hypothetical protein
MWGTFREEKASGSWEGMPSSEFFCRVTGGFIVPRYGTFVKGF